MIEFSVEFYLKTLKDVRTDKEGWDRLVAKLRAECARDGNGESSVYCKNLENAIEAYSIFKKEGGELE